MNTAALLLTALLSQTAERQYDFTVFMNTANAGSAQITMRDLDMGRRQILLTMSFKLGGKEARVRQETIYESDGAASRQIQEAPNDKGVRRLVVAELDNQNAKVTTTEGGKTTIKNFPLSAAAPRSNPSTFWFSRTQPKPGQKISYYGFDLGALEWRLETTQFIGKMNFKWGTQTIQANKMITTRSGIEVESWVDDQGAPLAILQGDSMRIERVQPK